MSGQVIGHSGGSGGFAETDPTHTLLERSHDEAGNEYVYVQASGAIDQYDCVVVDEAGQAASATVTTTATAFGDMAGAPQVALADNEYGWVQIFGVGEVNVLISCAANIAINSTATAGTLDDDATSGAEVIAGITLTVAEGGSGTDSIACQFNYPTVGATL